MKSLGLVLVLLLAPQMSEAAKSGSSTATSSAQRSGGSKFGLGVLIASSQAIGQSSTGLSGVVLLNPDMWIQFDLVLPSASPFSLMFGGQFKASVANGRAAGFHVGGGLGFGVVSAPNQFGVASSQFGFSINGLAGIHVRFPEVDNLLVSVDAGPTLNASAAGVNFAAAFLGVGAHYLF